VLVIRGQELRSLHGLKPVAELKHHLSIRKSTMPCGLHGLKPVAELKQASESPEMPLGDRLHGLKPVAELKLSARPAMNGTGSSCLHGLKPVAELKLERSGQRCLAR